MGDPLKPIMGHLSHMKILIFNFHLSFQVWHWAFKKAVSLRVLTHFSCWRKMFSRLLVIILTVHEKRKIFYNSFTKCTQMFTYFIALLFLNALRLAGAYDHTKSSIQAKTKSVVLSMCRWLDTFSVDDTLQKQLKCNPKFCSVLKGVTTPSDLMMHFSFN